MALYLALKWKGSVYSKLRIWLLGCVIARSDDDHPSDELLADPQSIPASGTYIRDIRDGWDGLAGCVMGMCMGNRTQIPGSKGKEKNVLGS